MSPVKSSQTTVGKTRKLKQPWTKEETAILVDVYEKYDCYTPELSEKLPAKSQGAIRSKIFRMINKGFLKTTCRRAKTNTLYSRVPKSEEEEESNNKVMKVFTMKDIPSKELEMSTDEVDQSMRLLKVSTKEEEDSQAFDHHHGADTTSSNLSQFHGTVNRSPVDADDQVTHDIFGNVSQDSDRTDWMHVRQCTLGANKDWGCSTARKISSSFPDMNDEIVSTFGPFGTHFYEVANRLVITTPHLVDSYHLTVAITRDETSSKDVVEMTWRSNIDTFETTIVATFAPRYGKLIPSSIGRVMKGPFKIINIQKQ